MTTPLGHSYCWAEHPQGGPRCMLRRGHSGDHHDAYQRRPERRNWPAGQLTEGK